MNRTVEVLGASRTSDAVIAMHTPDSRSACVPAHLADPSDDGEISCAYAGVTYCRAAVTRACSDWRQSKAHTAVASPSAAVFGDDVPCVAGGLGAVAIAVVRPDGGNAPLDTVGRSERDTGVVPGPVGRRGEVAVQPAIAAEATVSANA